MKKIISIFVVIAALLLCGCQHKQEKTIDCPSCGEEVLYGNYCGVCGKPLSGSNETKPIATEPPVTEPITSQPVVIQPTPTEGLEYTLLDDDTYSVSIGTATDNRIVIPSTYNGKKVTTIGKHAFYDCYSLNRITIPNSVTTIGFGAFANCTNLFSITIPDSVTSIGFAAFEGCTNLTNITIPTSVTEIEKYAFSSCPSLTKINFKGTVKQWMTVKKGEFWKSGVLDTVAVCSDGAVPEPPETKKLKYTLLKDNTYAVSVGKALYDREIVIPYQYDGKSVTTIADNAFKDCSGLTSITIPSSVTTIGDSAFINCSNLSQITIPDSVTEIGDGAFNYCTKLTGITIPNSVTKIGDATFYCCQQLTSIIIPDNVTKIGKGAFKGCKKLTSIEFIGTAKEWISVEKGDSWNSGVPATSVMCFDGKINI